MTIEQTKAFIQQIKDENTGSRTDEMFIEVLTEIVNSQKEAV